MEFLCPLFQKPLARYRHTIAPIKIKKPHKHGLPRPMTRSFYTFKYEEYVVVKTLWRLWKAFPNLVALGVHCNALL